MNYTAEQVERLAYMIDGNPEKLDGGEYYDEVEDAASRLRDYAALLRELEPAKAVVTDELAERVLNRYVNECISHLDEAPVHLRVTAMRAALESVAPMLVSARKSCDLCDCTGDIHDQTGEWRGECPYCKPVSAQVPSVGITLCRHCAMPEMNCDCPDSSGFLRTLPRSYGVSRMDENDNVVLVSFCRRLTDDELRTLHIMLATAPKPETEE